MAGNFLGLFFLILGTAGISNALSYNEDYRWNRNFIVFRDHNFNLNHIRHPLGSLCRYKFGVFECKNDAYKSNILRDSRIDKLKHEKYPFFRRRWSMEVPSDVVLPTELKTYKNLDAYLPSQTDIRSTEQGNTIGENVIKGQTLLNYSQRISPDKSENPTQSDVHLKSSVPSTSSAVENLTSDLYGTVQKIVYSESSEVTTGTGISFKSDTLRTMSSFLDTEHKSSSSIKIEDQSTFSTETLENSPKDDTMVTSTDNTETEASAEPVSDDSTLSETKGTDEYNFSPTEANSSHETLLPSEKNLKTESTVLQDFSSIITTEVTSSDYKSSSSIDIQSTSNPNSKLGSTTSESYFSSTTDEDTSLKIISSSSDPDSRNTQNFKTETVTSKSPTESTSDDAHFQSKSSLEIESSTSEILETESTTERFISPSEVPLIPFTDRNIDDRTKATFSTESTHSSTQLTPKGIEQDHIIEISSIRTARVVVTSVFLVIALIVIAILAVYVFRLKRRAVHYDQLMLIP